MTTTQTHVSAEGDNVKRSAHTPGPWTVAYQMASPQRVSTIEPNICDMVSSLSPDEVAANAAHIVHCVNTHDALCDLLTQVVKALEQAEYYFLNMPSDHPKGPDFADTFRNVQAAIAKSKGATT